jgi:hypothetical protein
MLTRPPASQSRNDKGFVGRPISALEREIDRRSISYQGSAIMLSPGPCFAAFFLGVTLIAASAEADAQEQRRFAPPAPAARPPAPPAMIRPAPPPAMARPAPPAFRPAPQPQHSAIAPRPTPQIAAPPVAPAIAAPFRPSAPSPIARAPQQELIGQREQRIQQQLEHDVFKRKHNLSF